MENRMTDIKDITLAPSGEKKISFVKSRMDVLRGIEEEFLIKKPFKGVRIAMSIHLEAKTAYLARVLQSGGAILSVTGSNPLSTQDDIAAALAAGGMQVYAIHGIDAQGYNRHIEQTLEIGPKLILDDGGDFTEALHGPKKDLLPFLIGGGEETTTGVLRLRKREKDGTLLFPMIDVNGAKCKHLFDNRYGTGQSVWDAVMRTTNLVIAAKRVVVSGYGWCAKGIAERARGLGAHVIITEVDAVKALEAAFDGYEVMTMDEAAAIGDIFVTATGCADVITTKHYQLMKEGAIVANAGHFNVEANIAELARIAVFQQELKNNIMGYTLANGKTICVLAEGRLVNLAAGDGHPAEIMDMSFSLQALCLQYMLEQGKNLTPGVYPVPQEIDEAVARRKLTAMGISIDSLSGAQKEYLGV
jgi:adenosylhomocysteinase